MEVSPSASSCNSDGCVVAGIAMVEFRGAFAVTVVTGGAVACHRRGVTTVTMVVSLPAAVAHIEFAFFDFVRVFGEGNVLVAAVSREFAATR
ncbi:hypothetical protein DEO72_LG9g2276 [Vigna unguiculata]|uniref:Uncharacterized protein n=1 Tax=Vigna unguiculata TaxID=3917 RepID=A0A4D6N1V4_VIGUN|nr:hypothetical protein DEO72_LG9g2275 [Vigna unguiculata]QCE07259.1 hypothetical protein DEO72_LG9g2276 [Vigna unguiculata]